MISIAQSTHAYIYYLSTACFLYTFVIWFSFLYMYLHTLQRLCFGVFFSSFLIFTPTWYKIHMHCYSYRDLQNWYLSNTVLTTWSRRYLFWSLYQYPVCNKCRLHMVHFVVLIFFLDFPISPALRIKHKSKLIFSAHTFNTCKLSTNSTKTADCICISCASRTETWLIGGQNALRFTLIVCLCW